MEAITTIAAVNVVPSQRARWQTGQLAQEWRTRFPNLFDDDDLRIATSQPNIHFYEWLGAVVLHHATGYLALVEKYEFATHPRKQQVVTQLLPGPVRDAPYATPYWCASPTAQSGAGTIRNLTFPQSKTTSCPTRHSRSWSHCDSF